MLWGTLGGKGCNRVKLSTDIGTHSHSNLLTLSLQKVPAMYNIIETVRQLNGTAVGRQIGSCKLAMVYGNGGIFSSSAVAILGKDIT